MNTNFSELGKIEVKLENDTLFSDKSFFVYNLETAAMTVVSSKILLDGRMEYLTQELGIIRTKNPLPGLELKAFELVKSQGKYYLIDDGIFSGIDSHRELISYCKKVGIPVGNYKPVRTLKNKALRNYKTR